MKRNLTRRERLRKRTEIAQLFRTGKRRTRGNIRLLYRRNGLDVNRIAIGAGKACGSAVRRNREKRLVREAFRAMKDDLSKGYDMCIVVSGGGGTITERADGLRSLFATAGLLV